MQKILGAIFLCMIAATAQAQLASKKIGGDAGSSGGADTSGGSLADDNHRFYIGADYTQARLSVSDSSKTGGIPQDDYDSRFVDIRVGYRVLNVVGVELHYGVPTEDASNPGNVKTERYYAAFIVPTATLFNSFELGFPVGFSHSSISHNSADGSHQGADLNGVAFGVNAELPIRRFWHKLPDFRLTGGGTVYDARIGTRDYGFHYGLRWDFGLPNPFR